MTIFSTSSHAELGTGWFTYYLAKFGGFNYISKDIEVDPDETDSYFNFDEKPYCDKKDKEYWEEIKNGDRKAEEDGFNVMTSVKEAIEILEKKEKSREAFFDDMKKLIKSDDSWLISINAIDAFSQNSNDFVFTDMTRDQKLSSVLDEERYQALYKKLSEVLSNELELKSTLRPQRYPLLKKNIAFVLRDQLGFKGNAFALRISSKLMNLNPRKLIAAYLMAIVISEQLDGNRGMRDYDKKDFETTGFGYQILEGE